MSERGQSTVAYVVATDEFATAFAVAAAVVVAQFMLVQPKTTKTSASAEANAPRWAQPSTHARREVLA